jgi:transposase-like protein
VYASQKKHKRAYLGNCQCSYGLVCSRSKEDPALKQQACQLYLEGMGMRAIGRVLNIHHKTVSRWLVQAAQALPASPPQTEACSFIEIDELCTFIAKKNLNVGSG